MKGVLDDDARDRRAKVWGVTMLEDYQFCLVRVGAQAIPFQPAKNIFKASCCSCNGCAVSWASRKGRPVIDIEI